MNVSYTSISIGWREKPVKRIYNQKEFRFDPKEIWRSARPDIGGKD
jgi:hypothetical protein